MVYWSRVTQSQLKLLLHQWPKHYFRISYASYLVDNANVHSGPFVRGDHLSGIAVRPGEFCYNARFFASGYSQSQVRGRKEDDNTGEPRLNGDITGNIVRLVTDLGHNAVSLREALEQAKRMDLDLVEVQRNADPPVCKIMDYHREKYVRDQKEKDRAKSKSDVMLRKGACKEVRFTKKTELKDLKMKADSVKRLMERGYRVKCVALPSAKKYEEQEDLGALLSNLTDLLEDTAIVESGPLLERKQAYMIVRHVKFGPSKKGIKKKMKDVYAHTSTDTSDTSIDDPAETDAEIEDEVLLSKDYVPGTSMLDYRPPWAVKDPPNNTVRIFNIPNPIVANRPSMDQAMAGRDFSLASNAPKFHYPKQRHGPETAEREVSAAIPEPATFENRYKRSEPANNHLRPTSVDSKRPQEGGTCRFEPQSLRSRQRYDFRREPSSPSAPGNEASRFDVFSSPRAGGQSEANNSSNNNVGNRYGTTRRF